MFLTGVLDTEGKETITEGGGGDLTDTEESTRVSLCEETGGKSSTDEEGQESVFDSEEETESVGEDEDQLEGEGRSRTPSSPPLLIEKKRRRSHRRGRTRRRVRGTDRVRVYSWEHVSGGV